MDDWIDVGRYATLREWGDDELVLVMNENELFEMTRTEVKKLVKDLQEWLSDEKWDKLLQWLIHKRDTSGFDYDVDVYYHIEAILGKMEELENE